MTCLHAYNFIHQTKDGVLEVCKICKRRLTTRFDSKGRSDNRKYLAEHERDFAQPVGRTSKTFLKVYGDKKLKEEINKQKRK